ncbi:ubiquitin-specific protease [Castilleja foliolosa]|uniref:ubiquitinyl hydrolase 1 n=1 Tax=Castilleja foliolosa TaxID=1961234 RepID=A0ABD3CVK0_9LAMI
MLLEVNLGFLCSVLVVLVGWLAGRWKWQRVAARKEEIRRLMMLASEESERAELEAASGYISYGSVLAAEPAMAEELVIGPGLSPGRKLQHQCEVCLSPTTTRCKQCKAVRYCSRKCQIFHWRQGHKDECHSVSANQDIDQEFPSRLKEFNEDEIDSSQDGIQVIHNIKPVESSPDKPVSSNPIPHKPFENNDPETVTKDDRKQTELNVKSSVHEISSSSISTNVPDASVNILKTGLNKTDSMRQISSGKPSLANPEYTPTAKVVSSQPNSGCIDIDDESDSEELSEPSNTSGFWARKFEPKKSIIDALEFDDIKKSESCSAFLLSSGRTNARGVRVLDSSVNRVQTTVPRPDTSMPRKPIALSEASGENGLKARETFFNSKLPGQNGNSKEEAKLSSNASPGRLSEKEHNIPSKHVDNVSRLQSLTPKVVDHQVNGTNGLSDTSKSQWQDSSRLKSSEAHLTSSGSVKKTTTFLDAKSVENDCIRDDFVTSGTNPIARSVVVELGASNFNRHSTLGVGSGIMERYEGSFPYELFVKLYNWNKVELRPRGLKNCGNSCYANAVLQCLAFTPPLTAYFLQGFHAKTCHKKEWCFTCELEDLVKKAKEGNYPLSPARLMTQMQQVASLGNGREEDAHEFLRYAIEAMQLGCLKDAGVKTPSSSDEYSTLFGLTFGGYLQSKIQCMRCGGISKQHERIMDLTIEIGGEIGSLEDALRQFTRSEILDGENKYRCGRCKSYEKAKKKLRVLEAPNVLTIALKRFQSGEFGKLNKSVKFPEILNLAPYMRGTSDKSPIYQLYGAVVHLDVKNATFTGHYVCYVKNNQGKWFKADDSLVQAVEPEKVLSNQAYMLFYARCSPRASRLIRSSITVDPRKPKNSSSKPKFHPSEPWDFSLSQFNNHTSNETRSNSENGYLTEHSSFFSETGSDSTVSSNRGSTSTDDNIFDHPTLGDCWNRTTSDSETPSPSSSLSSPPRTRHSPLADLDRYSSDADGDGFWARSKQGFSCRDNNINNNADRLGNVRRSMMR